MSSSKSNIKKSVVKLDERCLKKMVVESLCGMLREGASIGFKSDDLRYLADDVVRLRNTVNDIYREMEVSAGYNPMSIKDNVWDAIGKLKEAEKSLNNAITYVDDAFHCLDGE